MSRNSPEQHRERNDAHHDQQRDEQRAAEEELLHVWLADLERSEGCCLGATEEDEQGVEFILV